MEFPVSAVHMMQVTGRDEFLLIVSAENLATLSPAPAATLCAGSTQRPVVRCPPENSPVGADGQLDGLQACAAYSAQMRSPRTPPTRSRDVTVPGACRCLCMQDFLGSQTHPVGWDGRNTTYMWVRNNNTARSILNIRDASCGMWVRTPEGDFAGFSGAQGTCGQGLSTHVFAYSVTWWLLVTRGVDSNHRPVLRCGRVHASTASGVWACSSSTSTCVQCWASLRLCQCLFGASACSPSCSASTTHLLRLKVIHHCTRVLVQMHWVYTHSDTGCSSGCCLEHQLTVAALTHILQPTCWFERGCAAQDTLGPLASMSECRSSVLQGVRLLQPRTLPCAAHFHSLPFCIHHLIDCSMCQQLLHGGGFTRVGVPLSHPCVAVCRYAVWATMLYHRYQHRAEDFG